MSQQNVQVVRRWFDGLARGEPSPELCDREIQIRNWSESPIPGPYHGHEGLQHWWRDVAEAFDEVHFELRDVVEIDDERVLTIQRIVGRFRLTRVEVDAPWGSVICVRRGKIVSAVGYASPNQAKRAAGVLE